VGTSSSRTTLLKGAQLAAATAVAVGLGLPFFAMTGNPRSAYGMVRSANNLEILDGAMRTALGGVIVCVPMFVGALTLCTGLGWTKWSHGIALFIGAIGVSLGILSLKVSSSFEIGSIVTLSGSSALALITAGQLIHQYRGRTGVQDGRMETMGGNKH
jgi:hypothetical protein